MKKIDKFFTQNKSKRYWLSVLTTTAISGILTIWGIYGIGEYGIALFLITPFLIGLGSTILYGYKMNVRIGEAIKVSFMTLALSLLLLVVFAIEGLICIVMFLPIGMIVTLTGTFIGYALVTRKPSNSVTTLILVIISVPLTSYVENQSVPKITSVVTSIEVEADIKTVWKNVIEFPELPPPADYIFKAGISYPIDAKIVGKGVGSIRYCNFNTGSFVEPITTWDENRLLAFDVLEQPVPMQEISFWDVDAPHLHDYFVSKRGQFKLTKLSNGNVLLEGTTWYYHKIRPEFYWNIWSNFIIHKIHERVLNHIKATSENINL